VNTQDLHEETADTKKGLHKKLYLSIQGTQVETEIMRTLEETT
jgi:hypothetical protein